MDEKLIESQDARLRRLERLAQQLLPLQLGNGMAIIQAREMLSLIEAGRAELDAAQRRARKTAAASSSTPAHGSHSGVESECPCCEGLREVWAYSTNAGCFAFQPCPRCDGSGSAPPYASPNENAELTGGTGDAASKHD